MRTSIVETGCASAIATSRRVNLMFPALSTLIEAQLGLASGAARLAVVAADEFAPAMPHVRVECAPASWINRPAGGACRASLCFEPADAPFAAALIARLAVPSNTPVATDPVSRALFALAAKAAASDVPVMISGPTGTGKEVLARYLHDCSPRWSGPFVAVNCAALPEAMLEAMLFGHERGAFTGAATGGKGLFRAAHGGTLLLDEITELPIGLQAKLLRAVQEREVRPIGATECQPVDVRFIASGNRDLRTAIARQEFRADLFYRLAGLPLRTAALAGRSHDIPALCAALLLGGDGPRLPWLGNAALAELTSHAWPGNVRELQNVLQRARIICEDAVIGPNDLWFDRFEASDATPADDLQSSCRNHEFSAIDRTLRACAGRRGEAASRLGISERTLRYKLAAMTRGSNAADQREAVPA